jgi:hypothetical protein
MDVIIEVYTCIEVMTCTEVRVETGTVVVVRFMMVVFVRASGACDMTAGDFDMEDIIIELVAPSMKVVPNPRVTSFEEVEQQSFPFPSSQQNVPRLGSPHGNRSTLPLSFTAKVLDSYHSCSLPWK